MKTYDIGDLVRIDAAFGDISRAATATPGSDSFTSVAHGLSNNDPVRLRGAQLPAGVVEGQTYYVVGATADTFKVALTVGGAAIDLTGGGRALVSKLEDPATVQAIYRKPSGTVVTKVYVTDPEIVRDAQGQFSMNIDIDEAGTWVYRWESTGVGQAAAERSFFVRRKEAA